MAMDYEFLTCLLAVLVSLYMTQPHVYAALSILEICLGGTAQSLTILEPCIIMVRGRRCMARECDSQRPNGPSYV